MVGRPINLATIATAKSTTAAPTQNFVSPTSSQVPRNFHSFHYDPLVSETKELLGCLGGMRLYDARTKFTVQGHNN